MAPHTSAQLLLTPLLSTFRSLSLTTTSTLKPSTNLFRTSRTFTTTPPLHAKPRGKEASKTDPRISLIRYHLQHPKTPRPLKLSRMRALRHWTIHRAWLLARRKRQEGEEGELKRMHQSMHNACEALRTFDAPGKKEAGRLYRIAMEKKGIFGHGGIPIEYARAQTDTPAKEAWNHDWVR